MTYSEGAVRLVKMFEGCRLRAYQDQGSVWTIGWGHTGPDVVRGMTCTIAQANNWLEEDLAKVDAGLRRLVTIPLNQNQYDAVADFVFNLGLGALEHSTLLRDLNDGDFVTAALQFPLWDHVGGVVVPGLLNRRKAEMRLFNTAEAA